MTGSTSPTYAPATDPLAVGEAALAASDWKAAREAFEAALADEDTPAAHDGLGRSVEVEMQVRPKGPIRLLEPLMARMFKKMIGELPERMRRAVALLYFDDCSNYEMLLRTCTSCCTAQALPRRSSCAGSPMTRPRSASASWAPPRCASMATISSPARASAATSA